VVSKAFQILSGWSPPIIYTHIISTVLQILRNELYSIAAGLTLTHDSVVEAPQLQVSPHNSTVGLVLTEKLAPKTSSTCSSVEEEVAVDLARASLLALEVLVSKRRSPRRNI
jgi:hypothetical protein